MSGGSYEYICYKDAENLFNFKDVIERMAIDFESLGYADDVAKETKKFIIFLYEIEIELEKRRDKLQNIWHAMEWWQSGDWSEDRFKKALDEYRKDKK